MPFNWADKVWQPAWLDAALREAFLDPNPYSVATYFKECTFGLVDLAADAVVRHLDVLPYAHGAHWAGGQLHSSARREGLLMAAADRLNTVEPWGGSPAWATHPHWVVFMVDPPSPAGAWGSQCVLDWSAPHNYLAHEVGHILGWQHSWGETGEYGDPYCIMSAEDYSGTNPTHKKRRPDHSRMPVVHAYPKSFWNGFGPMPAAATLFVQLQEFAQSPMVSYVGLDRTVTVKALSEAGFGQTVLAITEIDGVDWTAELRIPTNWDRGLEGPVGPDPGSETPPNRPGAGVVLHSVPRQAPRRSIYRGRIPLDDPRQTNIELPGTDTRLVLEVFDAPGHTAQLRFTRGAAPAAVGMPAPEFLPEPVDRQCAPAAGQFPVALPEVYELARNGGGERARIHIVVTTADGRRRIALSERPVPDPGTGGISMVAHECEQGRRVAQWTVSITEFLGSYVVRLDGPGLNGETGSVAENTGWRHTNPDGTGIEVRSWRVPAIF